MGFIKNIIMKIIGTKVDGKISEMSEISRTKIIAVIAVLIVAIQTLPAAWGHPVTIPPEVFKLLEAAGLWTLRDAIKA